jgi:hypothetical protein
MLNEVDFVEVEQRIELTRTGKGWGRDGGRERLLYIVQKYH